MAGLTLIGCAKETSAPVTSTMTMTSTATTTQTTVSTATTTQTTTVVGKTEILWGAVNSLTGNNVMTGAEQKWAYEKYVKDINTTGGIMVSELGKKLPVRLVFEDDESTPDGAAAAMEKLIKIDKVDMCFGSNIDKANNAAAVVADKYKMYFSGSGGWWGDDFEAQGYQYSTCLFFSAGGAAETPFKVLDSQPADQRPKAIAIMVMNITDGTLFGQGVEAAASKYGYTVVSNDAYTQGAKDFSSSILKMKSAGADALIWLGSPPDGITLIRQMKEQDFNLKYVHGYMGFWNNDFQQALGADANYLVHDAFWAAVLPYPGNQELDAAFRADHNGLDSVSVGIYYANMQCVTQAIEKCGSLDSTKVNSTMRGGTFTGTTMGDLTFKADGWCETQCLALQWMDGKRNLVWPTGLTDWTLKWIPPWDQR
jgi:branched-chain amino acid transport system substrate-binding protein